MSNQKRSADFRKVSFKVTAAPSDRAATEDSNLTERLTVNYGELLRK